MKGGDQIEVFIPLFVVQKGLFLQGLLHMRQGDAAQAAFDRWWLGQGQGGRYFKTAQDAARISGSNVDQVPTGLIRQRQSKSPQTGRHVCQGTVDHLAQSLIG